MTIAVTVPPVYSPRANHMQWSRQAIRRLSDEVLLPLAMRRFPCSCAGCETNQGRCVQEARRRDKLHPCWSAPVYDKLWPAPPPMSPELMEFNRLRVRVMREAVAVLVAREADLILNGDQSNAWMDSLS